MPPKRKIPTATTQKTKKTAEKKEEKSNEEKRGGKRTKKEDNVETLEVANEKKPVKRGRAKKEGIHTEKPVKRGRATKDISKKDESESEEETVEKPVKKGRGGKKESKPKAEGEKPVKNQTSTSYNDIDFTSNQKNKDGKTWNFKISNWNVDGIRAWFKKGGLDYIKYEKPDIFCLQETKCSEEKLPSEVKKIDNYHVYWHCSKKEGYAGVGLYTKIKPLDVQYGMNIEQHDEEGRMITAEYDKFFVVSVYVPNAGRGLVTLPKRLEWNQDFKEFIANLNKKKPVIICGDMNVAHSEIDLANPKTNMKNAGFTKEEREGMTEFLSDGYVDTFRELYPEKTQAYTFWSYMSNARVKNIGCFGQIIM